MRSIEFYIDINSWEQGETAEYKRLDTFGFENIEITSKVQDVRDIAKVFTDFSSTFRVPASKENNKTFSRWFDNGFTKFDGRVKKRGIIKADGYDFRLGYWKLARVTHKNDKASSYELVFFGQGVSLKDLLKDDLIQNLPLSHLNHDYNLANVKTGLKSSLSVGGSEIKYPLMSHTNALVYDSSAYGNLNPTEENDINLYSVGSGNDADYGLDFTLLKPAIKVSEVVAAIETKYGIDFSNDFFNTLPYQNLWLYCHKEKGAMLAGDVAFAKSLTSSDFTTFPLEPLFPVTSFYAQGGYTQSYSVFLYTVDPSVTTAPYRFTAVDKISLSLIHI